MRVAMVGSRHLLSGYSGIERGLAQFAPLLVADGIDITVYGGDAPAGAEGLAEYRGVALARAPHLPGKHLESLSRSASASLLALCAGHDLIHFLHQGPGIFSLLTRTLGVPSVVTVCGLDWQRDKWNPAARRAIRAAEQAAVRCTDGIAVRSRRIQAYFRNAYDRETTYIPNGLPEVGRPCGMAALERFGLAPESYVLFAGRLVPEKGCHDLLAAWGELPGDPALVVSGTAPEAEYVARLRKVAQGRRVVFTGHLEQEAMQQVMAACRLFVLPSYLEGMSNALLEAIALQRPILASAIPENLEALDGVGATFPAGDVPALRAALERLLSAPEALVAMRADLAQTVLQRPRWSDVARMQAQLYAEAVARRRSARSRSVVP